LTLTLTFDLSTSNTQQSDRGTVKKHLFWFLS